MEKSAPLRVWVGEPNKHESVNVTRKQILDAMKQYEIDYPKNDYQDEGHDPWLEDNINRPGGYKWTVWYDGKCYPGKHILRQATGYDYFYGGWGNGKTNTVFEELGFRVTPKPELGRSHSP